MSASLGESLNICLVCDFFLPRLGGVEIHQYQLAQMLMTQGHKVIIVTGMYGCNNERQGVRYMSNGLKVYYCPLAPIHNQVTLPTLLGFIPLFRQILQREQIDVVHGHQTTSGLAHQAVYIAKQFPHIRTFYTDHSLFNFSSPASIHVNKVMQFTLSTVDHVIAVSHTLRENLVLRAHLDAAHISVIPNSIDCIKLQPEGYKAWSAIHQNDSTNQTTKTTDMIPLFCNKPGHMASTDPETHSLQEYLKQYLQTTEWNPIYRAHIRVELAKQPLYPSSPPQYSLDPPPKTGIRLLVVSRLVYRKGTAFQLQLLPLILQRHRNIDVVIAGDGPHSEDQGALQAAFPGRICMLGSVDHSRVPIQLTQADLFIITSLTESFCIAALEAAAAGLVIVATNVGGIPEILPKGMMILTDPETEALSMAVDTVLRSVCFPCVDKCEMHHLVKNSYNWRTIAKRTIKVYRTHQEQRNRTWLRHAQAYYSMCSQAGVQWAAVILIGALFLHVVEFLQPESEIDVCPSLANNDELHAMLYEHTLQKEKQKMKQEE